MNKHRKILISLSILICFCLVGLFTAFYSNKSTNTVFVNIDTLSANADNKETKAQKYNAYLSKLLTDEMQNMGVSQIEPIYNDSNELLEIDVSIEDGISFDSASEKELITTIAASFQIPESNIIVDTFD